MSSRARGGVRRGRGRGRADVTENYMDHHETSVPSSPSTTSDREDNVEFTPEQAPVDCYVNLSTRNFSGGACMLLVGGSSRRRSSRRCSLWLKGSPSNLRIRLMLAVVFRILSTSKALCHVGGRRVTTQLAPISLSQVVVSPARMRLTASCFMMVEEEPDLIASSLLLLRSLMQNAVDQLKLRHHKPLKYHERYRPYLRDAGLLGLSQICQKMPQLDKALITALVERWRPETHSFHLASGEMTVTLQDVAMLFALPIDGRPVCSTTDHDYAQMVIDCLGHDPRGPSMPGKSFLHYKWLKKHFYELPEGADEQKVQRHVRAYILSLLCGVLFPDGTGRMSLIYLPLIADLSLVGTYSWGSAAVAFLYRALCSVSSSHNIKNIGGSLLLLQLWSWEHSHVGRPLARSPLCIETDIPQDLPPVGFRWVGARAQSENATRCLKQYRDELNLQRADQLKWEPYMLIESSSLPPLCTKDADLWITQAPLINFPIVEMYLPERVMRQFGLRQCIPPPFRPTLQTLHRISRRGRERENWEETHHEYIQEWEARRHRIFREAEQYDLSSYDEYLQWYSGATRRYLVPSTSDDAEAGLLSPPDDSSDLQYKAKSPMIRKAVDKLHGMMKKAKTAMSSTADTATQALVFEFLHGFEDVLHDLGEMKEKSGPEAPPFGSATGSYVDSAATQHEPVLLLEAEQNIVGEDQEAQYQEDEDLHLHTVEQATLALEHMDEENDLLLSVEEDCAASLATEDCETADYVISQHDEDADQAGHPAEMEHSVVVVEPMSTCEENNGFDAAPSPGPSSPALAATCDSAMENADSDRLGAEPCHLQQSDDVKLEDEDVATAKDTYVGNNNSNICCNGGSPSNP